MPKCSAVTSDMLREYTRYLRDVSRSDTPSELSSLLQVLTQVHCHTPHPPTARAHLHPLLIPLTTHTENDVVFHTGFLRWPTAPKSMQLPLVQMRSDDSSLSLLAKSAGMYVKRELAEMDFAGRADEIKMLGDVVNGMYEIGDADRSGLGIERYILVKIGGFMDLYEGLARGHLAKGDVQSALVTCEMLAGRFVGWGKGHVFHAGMLKEIGRDLEARDAARCALMMPMWTLGMGGMERMRVLAGYQEKESLTKIYQGLASDKREKEVQEGKKKEQVALDRAAFLMDLCAVQGGEWETVRMELADLYEEGGMHDFATFVRY